MISRIYLDNNATTRPAPSVVEAMTASLERAWGNPSSAHSGATDARRTIDESRSHVANLLGARSGEIVFTSGGTEADNLAILGALRGAGGQLVVSRVEHEAVRKLSERLEASGVEVSWIAVDSAGMPDLDQLRRALSPRTAVVSMMLANNETGVIMPVAEIGALVKAQSDALFHVDAVNAVGKIVADAAAMQADLVSISAHKFHGPKGVGALYVKEGIRLDPVLAGGGQEFGMRPGTEAVHQIAGIGEAAKLAADLTPMREIEKMRDRLEQFVLNDILDTSVNGAGAPRLPNTSNISFENTNGEMLLHFFDETGICVSTGSACNSASRETSAVLSAMDVPYTRAMGSIRFSLGRETTASEIDKVIEVVPEVVKRARSFSG